jgi:hypothetical protein
MLPSRTSKAITALSGALAMALHSEGTLTSNSLAASRQWMYIPGVKKAITVQTVAGCLNIGNEFVQGMHTLEHTYVCSFLYVMGASEHIVITDRKEGSGVASGVHDAHEIACAWTGIAWTMLLLTTRLGACLDLAGHLCNTLQYHVHVTMGYDKHQGHCIIIRSFITLCCLIGLSGA